MSWLFSHIFHFSLPIGLQKKISNNTFSFSNCSLFITSCSYFIVTTFQIFLRKLKCFFFFSKLCCYELSFFSDYTSLFSFFSLSLHLLSHITCLVHMPGDLRISIYIFKWPDFLPLLYVFFFLSNQFLSWVEILTWSSMLQDRMWYELANWH